MLPSVFSNIVIGLRRCHNGRFSVGATRKHKVSQQVQTCLTQRTTYGSRVRVSTATKIVNESSSTSAASSVTASTTRSALAPAKKSSQRPTSHQVDGHARNLVRQFGPVFKQHEPKPLLTPRLDPNFLLMLSVYVSLHVTGRAV